MSESDLATRVLADACASPAIFRSARHATAQGLAGTPLADRFCFWRGQSGRRYVFSVYARDAGGGFADMPRHADAVVIAAERCADGSRRILRLTQTGGLPELALDGPGGLAAVRSADELHVHLLAADAAGRDAVLQDLGPGLAVAGRG